MDHIEEKILRIIDENADKIIAFGDDIWHHAELGFMEYRTSEKFVEQMKALGLSIETGIAITGSKAYLKERKEDEVNIALIGEMDALPIANHPDANPDTGADTCMPAVMMLRLQVLWERQSHFQIQKFGRLWVAMLRLLECLPKNRRP